MKNKANWLEAALLLAPFVVIATLWNKLPARLPIHWNLRGEVDGWASSKSFEIFLLPLIAVAVVALLHSLPRLDPKLRAMLHESERMRAAVQIIGLALAAFFTAMFSIQIATALDYPIASGRAMNWCTLVLFAIIGNYLGNLRPNYFVGIRTPWTLESAATWRATHRLGGRLMFFGALLLLAVEFFLSESAFVILFVTMILLLLAWSFLYSWHHFRTHGATD
jgi:uncharacterized membrane protein